MFLRNEKKRRAYRITITLDQRSQKDERAKKAADGFLYL